MKKIIPDNIKVKEEIFRTIFTLNRFILLPLSYINYKKRAAAYLYVSRWLMFQDIRLNYKYYLNLREYDGIVIYYLFRFRIWRCDDVETQILRLYRYFVTICTK